MTPLGRIINRFSSDTNTIDDSLPFILNILLALIFSLVGTLSVSLFAMPWLALLIFPMIPIYFNIQSRYRKTSREVKRLSSVALSPIYMHFTETGKFGNLLFQFYSGSNAIPFMPQFKDYQ